MTTLLDTGPIVAAARVDDKDHERCAQFFADPPPGPLLLPSTVLIESCWLVNTRVGAEAHAAFLERMSADIAAGSLDLVELLHEDITRMVELTRTYLDARLDPTDVSVIALAERLHVTQVATLDRRDFTVVRPRHCTAFTLFP
ncbi:MAG: type II toxin-antitoxin system VapC family toxin [Streptosporangiaceae bacterium]